MSAGARVAFATEELAPFTAGGIGRLVHHLVRQAVDAGAAVHLFVPTGLGLSDEAVRDAFGATVTASRFEGGDDHPLRRSLALATHVADFCARHEPFEWIEFPDFRGLGFATIQRAATDGLRGSPRLHVRVHGPNALIAWHEEQRIDAVRALEFDLERACLRLADAVLAPMLPVRDAVAEFFRLDARWRERVRVELPPRVELTAPPTPAAPPLSRIIFPTKAQRIKRPDLFVASAAEFLRRRPHWRGQVILAAHRDGAAEASLLEAVPLPLRARFEWASWNQAERAQHFAGQIVVVPSDFETLSLAAWEAAAAGATLVASTRCPAFAQGSPWAGWPGFHGFDGGPAALCDALERAVDSAPPSRLAIDVAPFPRAGSSPHGARASAVEPSEIAVLVGDLEDWTRALPGVSAPWVLLLRAEDEVDAESFRAAAARALTRHASAHLVAAADPRLCSPTQAWLPSPPPTGPLVAPTALARQVVSPRHGRRALVAVASQQGSSCLALFAPVREPSSDVEHFPPLQLDAHPFALRAQRDGAPPLRTQLLERARARVTQAFRRLKR